MTKNDEDLLVGYVFGTGSPSELADARRLLDDSDAARGVEMKLRRLIAPLRALPDIAPPDGLAERTMASVRKSRAATRQSGWDVRSRTISRRDVAVSACLALLVIGLGLTVVGRVRSQHGVLSCQNNLRQVHSALEQFADNHKGKFPRIDDQPPNNRAAAFVPILASAGALTDVRTVRCPSRPASAGDSDIDFAYSLGHRNPNGSLIGPIRDQADRDHQPIVADLPPLSRNLADRSPSHGLGCNVLFAGGNVQFCKSSNVGPNGDHIFLNQRNRVSAGLNEFDSVLGSPHDSP